MSGTTGGSAYIGALIGTEKEYYDCGWSYSINTRPLLGFACAGAAVGYLASLAFRQNVISEALRHDVVTFDIDGMAINENDVKIETKASSWRNGCCMFVGCGISALIGTLLALPWATGSSETDWDNIKMIVPVATLTCFEAGIIIKSVDENSRRLDRQAAIERIKKKRMQQRK